MQVFFVCGAPKSGTTWLQRLLDAHPQVCCSGEGHFIDRFTVPLAATINSYNAHMQVVAAQVYEGRPNYGPVSQSGFDDLARAFILSRLTANADPGVQWVGDKTPRYVLDLPALDRIFPEARFINIVRDPRDVAVSQRYHAWRAGSAEALTLGSGERDELIRIAAADWVRAVQPVEAFDAANPDRVCWVRYEDLIARPGREADRIFHFLGAPSDADIVARVVAETSFLAQSGRAPGHEDAGAFLRRGVAGDWREKLAPHEVDAVEAHCGELMARHGYAQSSAAWRASA